MIEKRSLGLVFKILRMRSLASGLMFDLKTISDLASDLVISGSDLPL